MLELPATGQNQFQNSAILPLRLPSQLQIICRSYPFMVSDSGIGWDIWTYILYHDWF